jgi:hypothetical protein
VDTVEVSECSFADQLSCKSSGVKAQVNKKKLADVKIETKAILALLRTNERHSGMHIYSP